MLENLLLSDLVILVVPFADHLDLLLCRSGNFRCQTAIVAIILTSGSIAASLIISWRRRQRLGTLSNSLSAPLDDERVLRIIAEHSLDGLILTELNGRIIWANPAYCRKIGWRLEEIQGRKPMEFCHPPDDQLTQQDVADFVFHDDHPDLGRAVRYQNVRRNGERFWQEITTTIVEPIPNRKFAILVTRDVTDRVLHEQQLEAAREELEYAATHDVLTGLADRRMLLAFTDGMLNHPSPEKRALGLLHIDLNHFKLVNDRYGHAAGDAILVHVAHSIRKSIRKQDLACRLGGDEFVVACADLADFQALEQIAAKIVAAIAQPIVWNETELACSASIGIATDKGGNCDNHTLIHNADFALYEVKRDRSRQIACFNSDLHKRRSNEEALIAEFADVLDRGDLQFRHQPIFSADEGRITGFETLARWQRPSGEIVGPASFLPFAGHLGRRTEVDLAAMRQTVGLLAEFKRRGITINGSFNSSTDSLARRDIVSQLDWEMQRFDLDNSQLIVEVLETTWFGSELSDNTAVAAIDDLKTAGYTVYLDDFGIGYAALGHLDKLGISGIKIDRSLISRIMDERSALIIVTSLLRLTEELGLSAVAEGVETAEQQELLASLGCVKHQGFGIGKPMTREALLGFIEADHGCEPFRWEASTA